MPRRSPPHKRPRASARAHWEHGDTGVWPKMAKKGSGIPTVTDDEVVDIGLCYGWVSGQRKALDDRY